MALKTHFCRQDGDVGRKVCHGTLLHEGYRLKGIRFAALAENYLVYCLINIFTIGFGCAMLGHVETSR